MHRTNGLYRTTKPNHSVHDPVSPIIDYPTVPYSQPVSTMYYKCNRPAYPIMKQVYEL